MLERCAQIADTSPGDGSSPELDRKIAKGRRAEADHAALIESERKAAPATMPARWNALGHRRIIGERYLEARGIDRAELRDRGDVVRYNPSGDPTVPLRDLATGVIVGVQYRGPGGVAEPPQVRAAVAAEQSERPGVALAATNRRDPAPRPTRANKAALSRACAAAKMQLRAAPASICARRVADGARSGAEPDGVPGPPAAEDPVAAELGAVLEMRRTGADPKALRRALRRIEELLDE